MRSRVPVLLCVLLATSLLVGAVPVGAQSDAAETRMEVQLQQDGDARWTLVAVIPLENESDVDRFRTFAEEFESGERDLGLGVDAFETAASEAAAATGRDMTIHSTQREAEVVEPPQDAEGDAGRGELRVSFTWTDFARVEDDTIYVDDAFNTSSGTWLNGLANNQELTIHSPPGYGGPSTSPSPTRIEGGSLHWEGPQDFEPGYFQIVYNPAGAFGTPLDLTTLLLVGAVTLSLAALAVGLFLLWRREDEAPDDEGPSAPVATTDPPDEPPSVDDGDGDAAADPAPDDEPDMELLSDEERVEYLLERNGGRMKQASIVEETGWSNAKVSQLLSSMADEDRVDKLRIGRENLISLPGEGVADIEEPNED